MANVRITDPYTSHEAAESVQNITETQKAILDILWKPMTDELLIQLYQTKMEYLLVPMASQSGIRSRRNELVELGFLEAKGSDFTLFGRRAIVWGLVEKCDWCGCRPCQCNEIEDERTGN
jgi:hypothetical protein